MIRTIEINLLWGVHIVIAIVILIGIYLLDLSGIRKWVLEKLHAKENLELYEKAYWEDRKIELY